MFFVVDEGDRPLAPLPRKLVHGHGVWHRVAHIWVQNDRGQFLCQQRSLDKELCPGFWEAFFGGHVRPGEAYLDAAVRELGEELGINLPAQAFKLWKVYKFHDKPTNYNNEFQAVFVVRWNGDTQDATFDDGEVEQVAWKSPDEIKQAITKHARKSWTFCGYELDLLADQVATDRAGKQLR